MHHSTIQTNLYQDRSKKSNIGTLYPTETEQEELVSKSIRLVKANKKEEAKKLLIKAVKQLKSRELKLLLLDAQKSHYA